VSADIAYGSSDRGAKSGKRGASEIHVSQASQKNNQRIGNGRGSFIDYEAACRRSYGPRQSPESARHAATARHPPSRKPSSNGFGLLERQPARDLRAIKEIPSAAGKAKTQGGAIS
jgi:hypothetical protein